MRARESMHPLCCLASGRHVSGDTSPDRDGFGSGTGSEPVVAGVLHKWTNYGRGWRSRWFSLRNGVVSYAKIRRRQRDDVALTEGGGVRLIGDESVRFLTAEKEAVGVVNLKILAVSELYCKKRAGEPSRELTIGLHVE